MVKLDVSLMRYLTRDDYRVLTSIEMGMKNHELVPQSLVNSISSLRSGGINKLLRQLCQHKLVSYESGKRFDGYRLTYNGYDFLALNALCMREVIASVGNQIGVGKESDVYVCRDQSGQQFALKIHRLGRICFRKVALKRDYNKSGNKTNWIYLSRLAAMREFAYLKVLSQTDSISIPKPIDCNRHCVVMQLIDGTLLNHISKHDWEPQTVDTLYRKLMNIIIILANDFGLIHGDFNEFNIIIKADTLEPVLIDFPQMITLSHSEAKTYFERDVNCIVDFFAKRFAYECDFIPSLEDIETKCDGNEKIEKINNCRSVTKMKNLLDELSGDGQQKETENSEVCDDSEEECESDDSKDECELNDKN